MTQDISPECQQEINQIIELYQQQLEQAIQDIKDKYQKTQQVNLVHKVDTEEEFQKILEKAGDSLVVVDFTANWCGPCKRIAPYYQELSQEFTNVVFLKVDVDDNPETTENCQISSMPTFQFYQNKEKVEEFSGANTEQLRQVIEVRSGIKND